MTGGERVFCLSPFIARASSASILCATNPQSEEYVRQFEPFVARYLVERPQAVEQRVASDNRRNHSHKYLRVQR
jgi:hypothetical protein